MKSAKNDTSKEFSWKTILAYLKGERKGKAAHEIEKAASEDPFLADALEGYEEFGDECETSKNLREIENYIAYRKSQEKGSNKSGNRILAIAASFAVLISASLWVWFSLFDQVQNDSVVEIPQTSESEQRDEIMGDPALENIIEESEINSEEEKIDDVIEIEPEKNKSITQRSEQSIPVRLDESEVSKPKMSRSAASVAYESKANISDEKTDTDKLIERILEMEKEFWQVQNVNSMALNNISSDLMDDEAAAPAPEAAELMKEEKTSKKSKAGRSMAAGAAASERKSEEQEPIENLAMSPEEMIDSLMLGKMIERDDSISNNSENYLLIGISKLYEKDTLEAINKLKKAIPRSDSQRILIDSLLLQLNR